MTDAQLRELAIEWWKSEDRGGTSGASFWRWLRKRGIGIGNPRAYRIVAETIEDAPALIPRRVRKWEALGKDGKVVELQHVSYDVAIDWQAVIARAVATTVKPLTPRAKFAQAGKMLGVLSFPDLHIGQLSWHEEVGENYDSKIAERVYLEAAEALIGRLRDEGVGRVLYVVGNDLLHVDGFSNATTAGTPQDTDSRWQYMFTRARRISESVVMSLAEFSEVDVIIMPGNHDRQLAYALGHVLDARFMEYRNVHVENRARGRKYVAYGKLLFGITHGDGVKDADLPLLMAEEAEEYWGKARWREWLLGHFHRKKVVRTMDVAQHGGVQLTYLPSLKALDRWHYEHGFRSSRSAEVRIYDPEAGVLTAVFPYYVGDKDA